MRAGLRRARGWVRAGRLAYERARAIGPGAALARAAEKLAAGKAAGAPARAPVALPPFGARFDAIYAIGYWDGEPKRYRVFNMAEGLRALGFAVHVMPFDRLDDIRRRRWTAQALVLFRAEYDRLAAIEAALADARARGMRVVYDIDDLVFDPALSDRIDGVRSMGSFERRRFIDALSRRRRLMAGCDLVTVSTASLARQVEALGRPSAIVPNCLNAEQLGLAAEIAAAPRLGDDLVRIAYLSGSRTHQRDFAECEAALRAVLERHPEARFRLVGYLELGADWARFGDRVERLPFLPPGEMLRALAECDVNLAPLELGNPFCEGKSELKFFEAGLVGVPTIASATASFAAAIEDGVSGLLVRASGEWQQALETLLGSAARRRALGIAAREAALARHAIGTVAPLAAAALGLRRQDACDAAS